VVTCFYDSPAAHYALRVPAGVTEMHIEALGAAGGSGGTISPGIAAPAGGRGGFVAADFPVAAGQVLRILVGGHGQDADGMAPGAGGRHGGARGGAGTIAGGGGGGASSVRLQGTDPASRILVAGGGGGGGGAMDASGYWSGRGGAGGGERGLDGMSGDGRDRDGRGRAGLGGDALGGNAMIPDGVGRSGIGGDNSGKGGVGAVGPSGGAGLKRPTGLDGHSGYDADHDGGGGEGGYGTSNAITHQGTVAGGPVGAGGGGGGYAGGGGGAAGATVGGGGGGGSGFVATAIMAPTVARLGSIRLSIGTGSVNDGEVVIMYRLPADRHAVAAATPARSAATTSNKRRAKR
jgi:hypothetical protein